VTLARLIFDWLGELRRVVLSLSSSFRLVRLSVVLTLLFFVLLSSFLATYSKFLDEGTIPFDILVFQIGQQALTFADHLHQTTAGVMILLVSAEVIRQLLNPSGQKCDLHFG
jgi:hypothetical protein